MKNIIIDPDMVFTEKLKNIYNTDISECFGCAKCSTGCPVCPEMDILPHQMIRLVQLGQMEEVLSSKSIWLCLACETCQLRCPMGIDLNELMDSLKMMALKSEYTVSEESISIRNFNKSFLAIAKRFGRIFESGIMGLYKIKSLLPGSRIKGEFSRDMDKVPLMIGKGKIGFMPSRIKGLSKFKKQIKKVKELENIK